jgi:hypothetical protein
MDSNRKRLVAATAFVIMAGAALIVGTNTVGAQNPYPGSAPVNLVAPLPLPVTGTVAVTGAPTSVTVNNTVSEPVPVTSVDQVERVQFRAVPTGWTGDFPQVNLVTVPAGKLLVIEHMSMSVNENDNVPVVSCGLSTSASPAAVQWVPCQPTASNALNHHYIANSQTRMYATAGTTVRAFVDLLSNGSGFVSASIAGYYVPVP